MSWTSFTVRFGFRKPSFLPEIADPQECAEVVRRGLDWMQPEVELTADTAVVRLTMAAANAEAAMAHTRGSYRSALYTAGIPQVGMWPLFLLSVEEGAPQEVGGNRELIASGASA